MRTALSPRLIALLLPAWLAACAATQVVPTPNAALGGPADVEHQEGTFTGDGDLRLFWQSWRPKQVPVRGTLLIMHGLKDYSGHYAPLAESLTRRGFAVYGFDLPGHGRSEGERGYVHRFKEYLDDLGTFVELVQQKEPGRPLFIYGHSMGGAVVTLFTLARHPAIQGLALTGPALMPGADVSPTLIRLTKILGTVTPHLGVMELDQHAFSRDPEVAKIMDADPLVYQGKGSARLAAELLRAMTAIQEHEDELTVPLLVMHGAEDQLTNPEGSKELVAKAKSTDKTLKVYYGCYHDLLREPEGARNEVAGDLTDWLIAHLPPAQPEPKKDAPAS